MLINKGKVGLVGVIFEKVGNKKLGIEVAEMVEN